MPANDYRFVTHWRIKGDIKDVYRLLSDAAGYVRWWPEVYLKIDSLTETRQGVGAKYQLLTKGRLPYTLLWELTVTKTNEPFGFSIDAAGDFVGTGEWKLAENDPYVDATFVWTIRAEKPLLRRLSFILKPLFRWNHRWAMAKGEEGLKRELAKA